MTTTEAHTEPTTPDSAPEADDTTAKRSARKPAARKPGGRKTASRFPKKLAGGEDSAELEAEIDEAAARAVEGDAGGITAALANLTTIDGYSIRQIPVHMIAPHPYNDPSRSQPQPGNPKWDELVQGIKVNGVKVPGLLVTRSAFLAVRPGLAEEIGEAEFVAIYGHRRRAAVIAAEVATMPAVVDDTVMEDNGDLDAMTLENLGREDLGELAEARMFARYSDLGMGQRAIADKLGMDQGTVSRRMALLLLAPEIQQAIEADELPSAEGAALAGALPFGPVRRWQKKKDPAQDTDERHAEQRAAFALITEDGMNPTRAAERIITERKSREQAAAEGFEVLNPREKLGERHHDHRLFDADAIEEARKTGALVASIDPYQGTLVYYTTEKPKIAEPSDWEQAQKTQAKARAAAMKARREACVKLISAVPAKDKLLTVLIDQAVHGIAGTGNSSEGWTLAQRWSWTANTGPGQHGNATEYKENASRESDPKRRSEVAWACAIAGYEINAASTWRKWGRPDLAYMALLTDTKGVSYEPTAWEQARLEEARRDVAAEDACTDDLAEAIRNGEEPAEAAYQDSPANDTEQDQAEQDSATTE